MHRSSFCHLSVKELSNDGGEKATRGSVHARKMNAGREVASIIVVCPLLLWMQREAIIYSWRNTVTLGYSS